MGDVVNLGRIRKADNRVKKAAKATENAAKFGLTKAQQRAEKSSKIKAAQHLDNHRLDKDG
ncbi:MAG: DUF4169 family protein [Alphaproteobacteria bacterium]|nr:DUF4169 family protein [Alphaproteobacteria bacterium]